MKATAKKKIRTKIRQVSQTFSEELLDLCRTMTWASYGRFAQHLCEPPKSLSHYRRWKPEQLSRTIWKAKRYGWLEEKKIADETYYRITKQGRIKQMIYRLKTNRQERGKRAAVVIFDIPEGKRTYRNFLRRLLKQMKFTMVQRSVFITPFILTEQFYALLKEMGIWEYVKIIEGELRFH